MGTTGKTLARGTRPRSFAGPRRRRCGKGADALSMRAIGIDVGGTFTDLVAIDAAGRTVFAKSLPPPGDQSIGVMAGLEELARRLNLSLAEMLAQTQRLVHGTTVATN